MQPDEPLSPGETYFDEGLGIEVVAVESTCCEFPSRFAERNVLNRIPCAYQGNCQSSKSCVTDDNKSDIVYVPKLQYATFKLTQLVI